MCMCCSIQRQQLFVSFELITSMHKAAWTNSSKYPASIREQWAHLVWTIFFCRFFMYHLLIKFTSHSVECVTFKKRSNLTTRLQCILWSVQFTHNTHTPTLTLMRHWNWIVQIIYANPTASSCVYWTIMNGEYRV